MIVIGNPNVSNPFLFRDNQYVTNGNVSWLKGAHSFRFGFEYSKYDINHFQPQASNGPRGGFNFTGGLTSLNGGTSTTSYNSWGDFLLGLPQSMGKDVQYMNPATVRMPSYGFYARDAWQASRKLTIDIGIRFQIFYANPRRKFQHFRSVIRHHGNVHCAQRDPAASGKRRNQADGPGDHQADNCVQPHIPPSRLQAHPARLPRDDHPYQPAARPRV